MKISEAARVYWLLGFDCMHLVIAVALLVCSLTFYNNIAQTSGASPLIQMVHDWDDPLGYTDIRVVS
jgi:hypothetical protein